jgi:hypothetical protein
VQRSQPRRETLGSARNRERFRGFTPKPADLALDFRNAALNPRICVGNSGIQNSVLRVENRAKAFWDRSR